MTIRGPLKTTASSFHRRTPLKGATGAMGAVPTWLVEGPPMYVSHISQYDWVEHSGRVHRKFKCQEGHPS